MLFQLYGSTAMTQLLGWVLVFAGLVILNEIGRRTKIGGIVLFVIIPAILTIYFIAIQAGLFGGHSNQTYEYMNGWFHYAKLYAADIGVVGFLMIKYKWGIGKKEWFKPWPFIIVAINILIAVASDFESAIRAYQITGDFSGAWWASNEGVFLYGGWWNIVNGIAGLINIFCMTGWWGIYSSKKKDDMLWPDMTIWFIVAYDIWNFEYTYCNLPTHTWSRDPDSGQSCSPARRPATAARDIAFCGGKPLGCGFAFPYVASRSGWSHCITWTLGLQFFGKQDRQLTGSRGIMGQTLFDEHRRN